MVPREVLEMTFEKIDSKGRTITLDVLLAKEGETTKSAARRLAKMGWNIPTDARRLTHSGQVIRRKDKY
jgi:hypothetical protein